LLVSEMMKRNTPFLSLLQMAEMYNVEQDMLFERLLVKLSALRNLFIVAERGWGLEEYMDELGFQLTEKYPDIHICRVDLKPAHDSDSFLELFAAALCHKFPEETKHLKKGHVHTEILEWPSLIARRKKIRVALFLANAHLLYRYTDRFAFLKQVTLKFINQKKCVFCLYGQISHVLMELVQFPGPLCRIGQLIQLKHDPTRNRSASIRKLFQIHEKKIEYTPSVHMSYLVDNHPFYLKLMVWHALIRTNHICTYEIINQAMEDLILHFDYQFRKIEEGLTEKQTGFLRALLERNQKLGSEYIREKYQLGTTGHVARIKMSLEKKELIKKGYLGTHFSDPIFREWFRKRYGITN